MLTGRSAALAATFLFFAFFTDFMAAVAQPVVPPVAKVVFNGNPVTLKHEKLTITVSKERSSDPKVCAASTPCPVLTAKGEYDGQPAFNLLGPDEAESTEGSDIAPKVELRHLDASTSEPQVVLTYYTGGAHCCTSTKIATMDKQGVWHVIDAGYLDGEGGFRFLDAARDGSAELVGDDESFLYKFASHAGSYVPTKITMIKTGQLIDVTKDAKFYPFAVQELRRMEDFAKRYPTSEINGYLAGWVAQKALIGEIGGAWAKMIASYDRRATGGLELCRVEERVWIKSPSPRCPQGQQYTVTFPEALAFFLVQHGYLGPDTSKQLGVDFMSIMERQKAATVAYERAMGLVAGPPANTQSQNERRTTGPSFTCPVPRDPLAQLICDTPALSRFDLVFVQTYLALRQQVADQALQQSLRQESLDFGRAVRTSCGIATAQSENSKLPPPPPAPPGAGNCVLQAYQQQRAIWSSHLTGPAAEEAARSIEQQVSLQRFLQRLKYLADTDSIDGVFGTSTRAAIIAWQTSTGRSTTGLLGDTDAQDLMQAASHYIATNEDRQKAVSLEDQKAAAVRREIRQQDLKAKYGDRASDIIAGKAQIGMTQEEILDAKGTPSNKNAIPPNHEVWVYDHDRIAFTDGKVTHVGVDTMPDSHNPTPGGSTSEPTITDHTALETSLLRLRELQRETETNGLSVEQRGTIGAHVRKCWSLEPTQASDADRMSVVLHVVTDASGTARVATVAEEDRGKLSDPVFQAFAERAVRAVMDARCATLPLPPQMLGRINNLTLRFRP